MPEVADETAGVKSASDRRVVLKASLATLGAIGTGAFAALAHADPVINDVNILNFALNLEYLEAEFYLRAVYGHGLGDLEITGSGNQGDVKGGAKVTFNSTAVHDYAAEIAADEKAHVLLLRRALGSSKVARPAINFTDAFNTLAKAAGLGDTFDPFSSEDNFLIGAFVFEDVGVTAYHGAAQYISNKSTLDTAAGILAVEAYHAGIVRTILSQRGMQKAANAISATRDSLDGNKKNQDQGIVVGGQLNLVPTDANSVAFERSPSEVLGIVYAGGSANNYGFFPNKVNGAIS